MIFAYSTKVFLIYLKFCFDEKVGIFTIYFQKGTTFSNSATLSMHPGFTI